MASKFKKFLKTFRAEQEEKPAWRSLEAAKLRYEKAAEAVFELGMLRPGKFNIAEGHKTVLHVNDGGAVFSVKDSPVSSVIRLAQTVENSGGETLIKQFETRICVGSGLEYFLSEKKDFGGIEFSAVKAFYTDSKGIVIPLAEVHARLHTFSCGSSHGDVEEVGPENNREVKLPSRASLPSQVSGEFVGAEIFISALGKQSFPASVGTWISHEDIADPVFSGPVVRKFAFESLDSPSMRRLWHLRNTPNRKPAPDSAKLIANAIAIDQNRLAEKWARITAILSKRKDAPETEIPLPEGKGYAPPCASPTKVMSFREQQKALKRRYAERKAAAKTNPHAEKITLHEEKIVALQIRLNEVRAELRDIQPGTVVPVKFRKNQTRVEFSENVIPRIEERKFDILDSIQIEKDAIADLKGL